MEFNMQLNESNGKIELQVGTDKFELDRAEFIEKVSILKRDVSFYEHKQKNWLISDDLSIQKQIYEQIRTYHHGSNPLD